MLNRSPVCAILAAAAVADLLAAALLATAPPTAHADGPGDWPMFRHDPARTGYNPDETQLKPPLRLKWSYTTAAPLSPYAAVANGIVYVVGSDGKLYALDASTGSLRWSYTTVSGLSGSPAVANGVVYIGSRDGTMYALDAATGAQRWSFEARTMFSGPTVAMSSPIVTTDTVYFGADDLLYAVHASSGAMKWQWQSELGKALDWPPAFSNNVLYATSGGKLYALDSTEKGTLKWSYDTGTFERCRPWDRGGISSVVAGSGAVFVSSGSYPCGMLEAIDAAAGSLRSIPFGRFYGEVLGLALADGVLYTALHGSPAAVRALDAQTGVSRWYAYPLPASNQLSSPTVANGMVYLSTYFGLSVLDAQTGTTRWEYPISGVNMSFSPIVANGMVFVIWRDRVERPDGTAYYASMVYAFEALPPPALIEPLVTYQTVSASFPISWTVPASGTGTAVASYDVQYRDGPSGDLTDLITATTALSTTFSGQDGHTYYFQARSRTVTGAVGDWSDPISTTVDLTPPSGTLQAQGWSSPYFSNTIALSLSASDATSGVSQMQFGSDGQSYNPSQTYAITSPYTLAPGATTVYARFRDKAGNTSQPVSATVPLDATPPGTPQPDDGVSGTSNNPRSSFRWTPVTDDVSGVEWYYYKVDSGPEFLTAGTAVTLTTQSDGDHTFYVRAKDRAGNYSPYGSHAFSINNNLPQAPTVLQPQTPTASDRVVVNGTSDPGLTVKLYVNGSLFGQATPGGGSWNVSNVPLTAGANILYATTTNQAGNTSLLSTPVVVDRVTVWATPPAPQASAVISATGGTLAASNGVSVTVPSGALAEEVVLSLTPYAAASAPQPSGMVSADAYTSISAVATFSGATIGRSQVPITVTITYDPAVLGNIPESNLQVSYYDDTMSRWVALSSAVNTVNHTASASTTHLSVFNAQTPPPVQRLYLPLLLKRFSGW